MAFTIFGVNGKVQLPKTHTSPAVYGMETLGSYTPCTTSGTVLTCPSRCPDLRAVAGA